MAINQKYTKSFKQAEITHYKSLGWKRNSLAYGEQRHISYMLFIGTQDKSKEYRSVLALHTTITTVLS